MTKQEAIEHLTAYRDMWKVNTLTRGCTESVGWVTVEALDMAIEALSTQEENPCDSCQEFDCYGCEYKR